MGILSASKYKIRNIDIQNAAPALISYVDADLRYSYANDAFLQFYNTSLPSVVGKTVHEFLGTEIYKTIEKFIQQALQGESSCFEVAIETETGTQYLQVTLTPDTDPAGNVKGYISFVNNISGKKEALVQSRDELRKSEERYYKMVEEVQDYAIILLDTDGNILDWNKGAEKIKGYKAAEIIGQNFRIFYLPEDRQKKLPETLINKAISTGKAEHEGWRVKKDGTRFWGSIIITALHDSSGHLIGFTKVTRDLTERKAAEDKLQHFLVELQQKNEQLRRSEERYHKMIAEVEEYAIILLDVNGNIQNWNRGAENIKGYKPDEIVGQHFSVFYTKDDREKQLPQQLLEEARLKGKANHEGWRVKKDGSRFWGAVVITALHNEQKDIIGYSKVTRDLTERKLADERLKQNAEQLESQNKELEHFAYVASHDLQEPLRKIRTFNSLILEHESHNLSPKAVDYFERSISAADRMQKLIDDLLNYSRATRDTNQLEQVDLNAIVSRIRSSYRDTEKEVTIESDVLPEIKGMRFQLEQLFENIIGNGIKYQEPGSHPHITIRYKIVAGDELKGKAMVAASGFHQVSVSDNGIGFDQQHADKIFEMFHRLHGRSEYSGSGIGLAIVKKIVHNYGGFITAESTPGKGSTFHVYFPV